MVAGDGRVAEELHSSMAGLAGIVALRDTRDSAETVALVETMGRVQSHRGPPGWRVVSHPGLVHVAPSEDPTPATPRGPDGLEERPGGLCLAFDGEITNRGEIRTRLKHAGAELRSESDRELVLRAWGQWGEQCLDHLEGRFAFVLHDPANGASFLVRDRFGHRPFHYAFSHDRLCFASEIKTLLAVTAPPALDELALLEWSLYGDVLPPRTLFRGIRTLARGHVLRVGKDGESQECIAYYDQADVVDAARYAEYAARSTPELLEILESALDRAVVSHINNRREVGVMLSGGVDSTVIATLASRHAEVRTYNFSIGGDPRLDERPMANEVARLLGLPLQSVAINGETYRRELAQATYHNEMPLWHMHGVPIHLVARRAAEDGTSLLLSGFSLGPLLTAATDRYRWILPPPFLDRVPDDVFRIVRKAVYSAGGLAIANPFFALNLGVALQLVDGGARSTLVDRYNRAYEFLKDPHDRRIHVMRLCDTALFIPRFFHQADRLCMGASVDYCDAVVEPGFISLARNLPTDALFHKKKTTKWILKELATRYVPREIAFQKKIPLDVPLGEYFEPPFKQSLFENGFLATALGLDWHKAQALVKKARELRPLLYQLVNIETWGRLFLMQQSVDDVQDLLCR
jgi:asparagine synthase (glutamine-hydrolysing)